MSNTYGKASNSASLPLDPTKLEQLSNKRIVIKYGGAALERQALREPIIRDIAMLQQVGALVVIVHGGSRQLDNRMKEMGLKIRSIDGFRYTCDKTIDEAKKTFAEINSNIVRLLQNVGVDAIGLGAEESSVIMAQTKNLQVYGYVGDVNSVDIKTLDEIMRQRKIPVISALGKTSDGQVLNINADDVACAVASSLHADEFILITDVEGVLKDAGNPATLLHTIHNEDIKSLLKEDVVSKGMVRKIMACHDAIRNGVSVVYILSAQQPHALITEVTGESHYGTQILGTKPKVLTSR